MVCYGMVWYGFTHIIYTIHTNVCVLEIEISTIYSRCWLMSTVSTMTTYPEVDRVRLPGSQAGGEVMEVSQDGEVFVGLRHYSYVESAPAHEK